MKFSHVWRLCLVAVCLFLMTGCLTNSEPTPTAVPTPPAVTTPTASAALGEVSVFAASSLQDALDAMQGAVQSHGISRARYTYDISQILAPQLSGTIKPDVFISDDESALQSAVQSGAVVSGTAQELATAGIVAIAPPPPSQNQPAVKVKTLADLAQPGIKIAVVDPSLPAGALTMKIIDNLAADPAYGPDFKTKVLANIVSKEGETSSVLSKVQQAQADAGFVSVPEARSTVKPIVDANGTPRFLPVHTFTIPDKAGASISYYIAPIKGTPNPQGAQAYIDYLLSAQGQGVLESYGYNRRSTAATP